jgi:serine O-acetyltransferase
MFKQLRSDYRRHNKSILNPAFWAICNYRFGKRVMRIKFVPLRWILSKIYGFNLWITLITIGTRLLREIKIGEDFHIIHPWNIHIHPDTVIGDRCGIMHEVTIGTNMRPGAPVIGNDVFIGPGAKILGKITIGNGATIAANSLVIKDVPPYSVAIGVPAKIRKRKYSVIKKDSNRRK